MLRWGPKYAWSGSRLNSVQPKREIPANTQDTYNVRIFSSA
jgi:hypothetical protein